MSSRRYLSPLRYPGGKARMAPFLSELFADQVSAMDVEVWIEPFAGGAGASLALLEVDAVCEAWLTEKNPALAAFWRTATQDPDRLAARVAGTVPGMPLWEASKERVRAAAEGSALEDLDLALAALVVNRCSRSGIVTPSAGPIGGREQRGPWTVTSRWNGPALADRIRHLGRLAGRIRFTEGDAIEAIAGLAGSGVEDEVLVFVDPPYLREGNRLYANGMRVADHQRLADALNACPARWLLTYDDEPTVYRDLYPQRRVLEYQIQHSANRSALGTEYAVLSDNLLVWDGAELLPGSPARWIRDQPGRIAPAQAAA